MVFQKYMNAPEYKKVLDKRLFIWLKYQFLLFLLKISSLEKEE